MRYSAKRTFSPQLPSALKASRGRASVPVLCFATSPDKGDAGSWSLPMVPSDGDWREFRAELVARSRTTPQATWDEVDDTVTGSSDRAKENGDWAHILAQPEVGCVLLASPAMFHNSQTYFDKAVILIIDSSEQGSMGIILNKPSELRLKNMEDVVLENRFTTFAQNKVYLGGDVDGDGLYLLHEHDVPGAQQVRPGLFLGGAEGLCDAVNKNEIVPESVRWFCRYAGWAKGQLMDECTRNIWYPVSCSTSLLLPRIPKNQKHSSDMWHNIMELIGDDFRRVSQNIRSQEQSGPRSRP